jgi:hypothetical protein
MIRKTVIVVAALAVLLPVGLYGWGLVLPATVRTVREMRFALPPPPMSMRISDVQGQSAWRSDVGRVEISQDGRRWREFPDDGSTMDF